MNAAQKNILLIDDDQDALLSFTRVLKTVLPDFRFSAAASDSGAMKLLKERSFSVVVMDLCLTEFNDPKSGFDLLSKIISLDPTIRVIVLTGHGTIEAGVKCLEIGAANFLEKPPDIDHLRALIRDGVKQSELKRSYLKLNEKLSQPILNTIVGTSSSSNKLREEILYAASNQQSVFISGETGTGKGLCATAIHKLSRNNIGRFVKYQPNFSTPDLVNSDLFGHVKGAFTGAEVDRTGLLEEANSGTLFLDEVDEIPFETQISLLGVLQEKIFRSLGSNRENKAEFRLITATNRNIEELVTKKKIRQDFFHRIAHLKIHLLPLRERLQDIPILAEHFLTALRERESLAVFEIDPEVIFRLTKYSWPGNIRELQSVVEGGAYRAQFENDTTIKLRHIALGADPGLNKSMNFTHRVERFKIDIINEALERNNKNQVKTAAELEMDRSTMRRILERVKS